MKHSKKNIGNAGQSSTKTKHSKHDANLQKNTTLYFQIGLILCLLATYGLLEMQFEDKQFAYKAPTYESSTPIVINETPTFTLEQPKQQQQQVKRSKVLATEYKEVDDIKNVIEDVVKLPINDVKDNTPITKPEDLTPIEEPKEVFYIAGVEKVPVYPGCEKKKNNDERKKCMFQKITKLINRKFNGSIAEDYGLSGVQKIYTQFTIDKHGKVIDIKAKAPHPALEKEAKRVIDKILEMKPGLQSNKPVGVIYSMPITFKVRD